jgi:site-specific DNA-cytosine methylase
MNVLSLFDGMSCGQIALERAGIPVETYYASEIDKYAIQVTQSNYPNTIQLGDINNWMDWGINFEEIDLILAGSPCQGFSYAGKHLDFNDSRSRLFFRFRDILQRVQGVNPFIKFLLENVRMKKESEEVISRTLKESFVLINSSLVSAQNRQRLYWFNWDVPPIVDRDISLSDIIEDGCTDRQKDFCLDANYFKGGNVHQYFNKSGRQLIFKNPCILQTARGNNKGGIRGHTSEKVPCLSSSSWQYNNKLVYNKGIRKLTPIECERLQTVPDNYTNYVSNSQRYKMLGNGWTVDVISHLLEYM